MIHGMSNATIWTFTPAESSRPWIYISAHEGLYFYLEEEGWCEVGHAAAQKTQWLEAKVKSRLLAKYLNQQQNTL